MAERVIHVHYNKWRSIMGIIQSARAAVRCHEEARDTGDLEYVLTELHRVKAALDEYDRLRQESVQRRD